jgi:hypothetical protein
MNIEEIAAGPPTAEARFECSPGHLQAGRVSLHRGDAGEWAAVIDSFVCRQVTHVGEADAAALHAALTRADAEALYRLDLELAPFYCPDCRSTYCGECWRSYHVFDDEMPGWLEETRGVCPKGHDRMLVD